MLPLGGFMARVTINPARGGFTNLVSDTRLLEEINTLENDLSRLESAVSGVKKSIEAAPVRSLRSGTEETIRMIIDARAQRVKFLPADLFADPAWDMLLDLYLADIVSRRVTVTNLCSASNVPMSTALRWIDALDRRGLIDRTSDQLDARRFFISLSQAGLESLDDYFESLAPLSS
jgi:DNA-binding MarR family transcriptional regulator